jgi:hypothetical protein
MYAYHFQGVPEKHLCLVLKIMSNLRKLTRKFRNLQKPPGSRQLCESHQTVVSKTINRIKSSTCTGTWYKYAPDSRVQSRSTPSSTIEYDIQVPGANQRTNPLCTTSHYRLTTKPVPGTSMSYVPGMWCVYDTQLCSYHGYLVSYIYTYSIYAYFLNI